MVYRLVIKFDNTTIKEISKNNLSNMNIIRSIHNKNNKFIIPYDDSFFQYYFYKI